MSRFTVRMRHDSGTVAITVDADTEDSAIAKVCEAERAPRRSVLGVEPGPRPLSVIAAEIAAEWPTPYFGAVPYLDAMRSLDSVTDSFGWDSGKDTVLYFLSNAKTWRGESARRIKAELKAMVK